MASTIRAGIALDLKDGYSSGIRKASNETVTFGNKVVAVSEKMDRALSGTAAKMGGFGLSLGAGMAVKNLIDYQARLVRLGTAADMTDAQLASMKKSIFDVATAPDIKVDPSQITSAIEEIVQRTGDLDFATKSIKTLGLVIQATGGENGSSIGGLAAEFNKLNMSTTDMTATLDVLNKQGKSGAFTLDMFANMGPRLFSAYAPLRGITASTAKELGASMQIIMKGAGSYEQATTTFEAATRELSDPAKQKALKKLGIDVRDVTTKEFRPMSAILQDIVARGKELGNLDQFGSIMGGEAMRAVNAFKTYGNGFQGLMNVTGNGSSLTADAAKNAATLKANLGNLQSSFMKFADKNLTKPLEILTNLLNKLSENPKAVEKMFGTIAIGLGAIAAVKIGSNVIGLVNGFRQMKGGAGLGSIGKGVQQVYVVNMNGGGLGAGGPTGAVVGNPTTKDLVRKQALANGVKGLAGALVLMDLAGDIQSRGDSAKSIVAGGDMTGAKSEKYAQILSRTSAQMGGTLNGLTLGLNRDWAIADARKLIMERAGEAGVGSNQLITDLVKMPQLSDEQRQIISAQYNNGPGFFQKALPLPADIFKQVTAMKQSGLPASGASAFGGSLALNVHATTEPGTRVTITTGANTTPFKVPNPGRAQEARGNL